MNQHNDGKESEVPREVLEVIRELESALPVRFDALTSENFQALLVEAKNNVFLKDAEALMLSMLSQQRLRSALIDEINRLLREVKKFFTEGEQPVYDQKTRSLLVSIMTNIRNMSKIIEDFEPDVNSLKDSLRRSIEAMDKFLSSEEE